VTRRTLALALAAVLLVATPSVAEAAKSSPKRTAKLTMPALALEHATVKATAKFTPRKKGYRVQLQQRSGARWVTVAKAKQTKKGKAKLRFTAPDAGTYTYRVRTLTKKGKVYARSAARSLVVKPRATALVSKRNGGAAQDGAAYEPSISGDGRFVAYASTSTSLTPGDTNKSSDVFVADTRNGRTTLVSRTSSGRVGNGPSTDPSLSANGRFVTFTSRATDLVAKDANKASDVFRFDRTTNAVVRVSARSNSTSEQSSVSGDGRFVAYASLATTLTVENQISAGQWRVYLTDVASGTTTMVSRDRFDKPSNGQSHVPSISANGRYVAYSSGSANLVDGDLNGRYDVFVHDRLTTIDRLVSRTPGQESDGDSRYPSINADGRFVAYTTAATNLVAGDVNGRDDVVRTDLETSTTIRVTRTTSGATPSADSRAPAISGDGNTVAYETKAAGIVKNDTNRVDDVFAFTASTGRTRLVSANLTGGAGNRASFAPTLAHNGAVAAFTSPATDLVARSTGPSFDVFVRRRP
jgi:hypothetical protein